MRIETVVNELLQKINAPETTSKELTRLLDLTIKKVAQSGKAGDEAFRMIKSRMVRDALSRDINIMRLHHRQERSHDDVRPRRRKKDPIAS